MLIYWIRNDFRFVDNEALKYFSNYKGEKSCLYIYNENRFKERSAQKWWLYKSLTYFRNNLENKKYKFNFLNDLELYSFKNLLKKNNIVQIIWNKIYLPNEISIENEIINFLNNNKISYNVFSSNLLLNPEKTRKKDNTPFQVFTPFWKNEESLYLKEDNYKKSNIKLENKKKIKKYKEFETILPKKNWYKKFEKYWVVGEYEANKKLNNFKIKDIFKYDQTRDYPEIEGTSKLSPHLSFGEISAREIFYQYSLIIKKNIGTRKFINEIGWREFAYHLIYHFPQMLKKNLRKNFDNFPWSSNKKHLKKWKEGKTGYPIVDAAMRQMYEIGWMHNRLRMVSGSFLVKHLRINWIEGEKYFKDTLLDFDTANNVSGWQWIAGCGADAAPYFRIFNPMTQGEKFDPNGTFVRKWVPELHALPKKYIHKPWELPIEEANKIGFNLKEDYYEPIVNHTEARQAALSAFEHTKKK
tara:strand:+ start:820 stop:2226 length:1407 start_codon:yes stop_codon:yes gene_type:complete